MKHRRKMQICCLTVACILLLMTGCGGNNSSSSASSVSMAQGAVAETAPAMVEVAYEEDNAYDAGMPAASATESGNTVSQPVQSGRKLIRTVSLNVETKEFDSLLQSVNARIAELEGYAESSEISGSQTNRFGEPIPRYAYITARIPSTKLDFFVTSVEAEGNVTNKSESTEDVTLTYSDIESRKKSLEIEQERIWALLEKAETIDSIIVLEERLSEIRYELESMESRLRIYDNQVDYSTVYLWISEVVNSNLTPTAPLTASDRIHQGFSDNLVLLGTMITNFFIGILTASPFWIPLVILIFAGWKIRKKIAGKKPPKETSETQNIETK